MALRSLSISAFTALAVLATPAFAATADKPNSLKMDHKLPKANDKIALDGIQLITPEKEIEANVATADFTRFVDKADTAVQYLMYGSAEPVNLLIKFECTPQGKKALVAVQGQPSDKLKSLLVQLQDALNAIENMKVKSGKIEFWMRYHINA